MPDTFDRAEMILARAPEGDHSVDRGVAKVFTPKDYGMTRIMREIVDVVRVANGMATTTQG